MEGVKLLVCVFLLIPSLSHAQDTDDDRFITGRRPGRPERRGRDREGKPKADRPLHSLDDILASGYDYRQLPSSDSPTEVGVSVYLNSFLSIDSRDMAYTVSLYLRQQWRDPRLEHSGERIRVHSDDMGRVWKPDLYFRNEISESDVNNRFMTVSPDGTVWYALKLTATLRCPMKLQRYPFDNQTCSIMLESLGYTVDAVYFTWLLNAIDVDPELQLPQFTLADRILADCTKNYTMVRFTCLKINFLLERDVGYHVIRLFVPSGLVVVLSWVAFWLGRDAPTSRVVVVMLSMTSLLFLAHSTYDAVPSVSYVTSVDIWFAVCFLFVLAALLEIAGVEFFRKCRPRVESYLNEKGEPHSRPTTRGRVADIVSSVLFPVCFTISVVVYWQKCAL